LNGELLIIHIVTVCLHDVIVHFHSEPSQSISWHRM
jgi:hypothetical protein